VKQMGGPETPAVGWAAGIERLAMLIAEPGAEAATIAVIPAGDDAEAAAFGIVQRLRQGGVRADIGYRGNLRRRMERANKMGARAAIILGSEEAARGVAQLKDLVTGTQSEVSLDALLAAVLALPAGSPA